MTSFDCDIRTYFKVLTKCPLTELARMLFLKDQSKKKHQKRQRKPHQQQRPYLQKQQHKLYLRKNPNQKTPLLRKQNPDIVLEPMTASSLGAR
jgi:hypothetical protein